MNSINSVAKNYNAIMKANGMQSEMANINNSIYVIEESQKGEKVYDVFSYLSKEGILFLQGQVNDEMANILVAQMLILDRKSSPINDTMELYINSPGGSVTAGMAIYDTMQFIRTHVATTVIGQACSMGSLLASSGHKGKRKITPMARHMIHQPLGGFQGQASDIAIHAQEILKIKEILNNIYVSNTGQSLEKILKDTDRDNFLSAQESLDYGLVDQIVTLNTKY